jgi:hypothetical protein
MDSYDEDSEDEEEDLILILLETQQTFKEGLSIQQSRGAIEVAILGEEPS